MPRVKVFDNGGKTFDRYSVWIDGHVIGMSTNPTHPQGFNQYCGMIPLSRFTEDDEMTKVPLSRLPVAVLDAIELRIKE